ncbi:unnamed protein product [Durusdinium trenchii]|uniref:Uncharacterized protein n=1 Tax=Durusdinium trenchii TaxID=1381693 RepID=A0ABP0QVK4_9DINO
MEDFEKAIELVPQYAAAIYNRGLTQKIIGRCTASIEDFDEALKLNPTNAAALKQRGLCKAILDSYEAAIKTTTKPSSWIPHLLRPSVPMWSPSC